MYYWLSCSDRGGGPCTLHNIVCMLWVSGICVATATADVRHAHSHDEHTLASRTVALHCMHAAITGWFLLCWQPCDYRLIIATLTNLMIKCMVQRWPLPLRLPLQNRDIAGRRKTTQCRHYYVCDDRMPWQTSPVKRMILTKFNQHA